VSVNVDRSGFSPWLIKTTCHGRYPMDEISVRIALEMRRSFQTFFRKKRREFERALADRIGVIAAMRSNLLCTTEDTLREFYKI
jgi:hypothetical protein